MNTYYTRGVVCCLLIVLWWFPIFGQTPDKSPEDIKGQTAKEKSGPKPYKDIITSQAKTRAGLFKVHQVGEKTYFEIPETLYGKVMLWNVEVAKVPAGVGFGGVPIGYSVVKWERRNNKIQLRAVSYDKRSDGESAIQEAVTAANLAPILMTFDVETEGENTAAVIEVTRLLSSDLPDFSAQDVLDELKLTGPVQVDASRSYIEEIKPFPANIEIRSMITYAVGPSRPSVETNSPVPVPGDLGTNRSYSILVHYSLVLLPETPMMGRYFDPRVGYFTEKFEDYTSDQYQVLIQRFITRFRLEKKDPSAPISDPVKPIVFYISREVPEQWRPYLKQGVEDWKKSFEAAGFRNAIECRNAPTKAEDPTWDPEDARYSVIRWAAQRVENAMGPHIHDPRSGEIISAHIVFWQDLVKLFQKYYFVMCAPSDARARTFPLPESVIGEGIRYVAAHEVGHTLGLRHNHRASTSYSIKQLRDPGFTRKFGTTASIMSYGRMNYVAQPEDQVTQFLPLIGPYDTFAIEWGYTPFPEATSPGAEKPLLEKIVARQKTNSLLRFGGEDGPARVDPLVQVECISDDPIEATAFGIKNMDRVADLIVPATTKPGETYETLKDTYLFALESRQYWFESVIKLVGGVIENRNLGNLENEEFTRVPKKRQKEAVQFLLNHAFTPPRKWLQPVIVNRINYLGVADEVILQQRRLLESLLSPLRFRLLMDGELLEGQAVYTALEFVNDVQQGIWSELDQETKTTTIEPLRRNLQRAYLEHIKTQFEKAEKPPQSNPGAPLPGRMGLSNTNPRGTDFRSVMRHKLTELCHTLELALERQQFDSMSRAHLQDCRQEIIQLLNMKGS